MREDEGRKLMKPMVLVKLMKVMAMQPTGSVEKSMIHTLMQRVRYKQYVLTKEDMKFVNDMFLKAKGSK